MFRFVITLCVISWMSLIPLTGYSEMRDLPSVTILSASSMTMPITELARDFSFKHHLTTSASFDSSNAMKEQIIDGEQANIFITADQALMADLKQRGLIDVFSVTTLAKNNLVLVAAKNAEFLSYLPKHASITTMLRALLNRTTPVIADPKTVPLGKYTAQSLRQLGLWELTSPRSVRAFHASHALHLIIKSRSAGIVYLSDALSSNDVEILAPIPDDLHDPIIYQAAVVAGEDMDQARQFLEYLKSSYGKKIFKKYHFNLENG